LGQKGQARSYLLAMKKYYTETRALGRIQALLNLFNLVGEKAPELVVDNWIGIDSLSLEQLRGHVVLLDFWAPWCGPCRTMLPFLKNLYERYYDKGLEIIGVTRYYGFFNQMGKNIKNLKPSQELKWIKKFRTRYQVPYPYAVASMTSGQLNSLAYGVSGIPHTILIDRNGHVRMYSIGFDESKKSKIATGVMELINH
jgi:thiol-disulfide isomerase/thioredoxin